jgi:hypothetical protein
MLSQVRCGGARSEYDGGGLNIHEVKLNVQRCMVTQIKKIIYIKWQFRMCNIPDANQPFLRFFTFDERRF